MNPRNSSLGLLLASLISMQAKASSRQELWLNQPAEVQQLIQRRIDCNHWTGEEPYDPERSREIAAAVAQARCETFGK